MRRKGETAAGTQWLGIFANPDMPYKPSDFNAMTVGQLKYIASLIYSPLAGAGYTGLTPSWIVQNTNTDNVAANAGQLKQVFAWDIASAPATVSGVVATASNPGEIDLSWTNPVMNNATSFVIQQSTDGGTTWTTVDTLTDPTLNSYAVTGLSQGTGYQFQVLASNPLGGSSPASTPTPTNMAPVAPRYAVIDLGTNFFPVAINASGIVVGNDTNGFAAVWDQGTQTALAASSIGNGHATAINASGMIAGYGGFTYSQTNDDGSVDSAVETHACSWSPPYTSVTDLDTQQGDPDSDHNHWEFVEHDGWVSQALAISDNGSIYGFQNFQSADQPVSFSSNAAPVASNVRTSWDPFGGAQDVGSGLGGRIIGAAGTNWCGYYNISESNPIWTNGCIVNNQIIPVPSAYSNNSDFRATAINTNGVAVGYVVTNYPSSQPLFIQGGAITNLPGAGRASAINDLFTTNITSGGTVTNVVATPQIVGVDNSTNGTLWDQTMYDATPTTNTYLAKNLNLLIPGASGTGTNVPPWHVTSVSGINNGGMIIATAISATDGLPHGVGLLPLAFVREDPVGSGTFTPIKDNGLDDKAQLPVFATESGSGLAPIFSNSYSFTAQLSANLSGSSTASMVVAFTNSSGTFSGTVTETSAGSGVFTNTGSTFTVTLSPTTQTTSSTTVDTLNVTVTDSTLGLSSAPFTLVESKASSNYFAALTPEVVVTLPGALSTTVVNTIQLSLGSNTNPASLQTSLTETAVNSRIFQDTSGDSVTISSYTGGTTMNVAISTSFLPVSSYTAALTETTSTSLQYTNVQRTAGDAVVSTPSTDDEGVFYVQFPGSTATSITLVSGSNSVTTTASPVTGQPNLLRTGKLVLLNPGDTFSASGYTTLTVSPPSGGGKPTVQLQMYGQTVVDPGTAQNAFVGGIFHWYHYLLSPTPAALDTVRQKIVTLGWTAPIANKAMSKADVLAALPTHDFWFCFDHGHSPDWTAANFDGFEVWNSHYVWDYSTPILHPSDISTANVNSDGSPHEYQFVFLSCCWSAGGGASSSAMAHAFDADTYVGWDNEQDAGTMFVGANAFFDAAANHRSVQEAINAGNSSVQADVLSDVGGRLAIIGDSTKVITLK